jgi:hypothetical protein
MSYKKKKPIRKKDRVLAFWFAMISAVLLFASGTTGVKSWTAIQGLVTAYVESYTLNLLFVLILIIASLGGIVVCIGGYLVLRNRVFLGNLLILFGSGAGIVSLVINLIVSIFAFEFSFNTYTSLSSLGVLFALMARFVTKREKSTKFFKKIVNKIK